MSCLIVQILVNWANGRLGRVAETGKVKKKERSEHGHPLSVDTNRALCYCRRNSWMWCLYNVSPCSLMGLVTVSSCKLVDVNGIKQQLRSKVASYKKCCMSVGSRSSFSQMFVVKVCERPGFKANSHHTQCFFISLRRQRKCLRYTVPWFLDPTKTTSILKAKCWFSFQQSALWLVVIG